MGNMLFSQRVGDAVSGTADGDKDKHSEYRIFPEHMYKVINLKSKILHNCNVSVLRKCLNI
jgi:hypothetical protein